MLRVLLLAKSNLRTIQTKYSDKPENGGATDVNTRAVAGGPSGRRSSNRGQDVNHTKRLTSKARTPRSQAILGARREGVGALSKTPTPAHP